MVKITFVIKNLLATYYISGFIAKGANKALHKVSYCGNNDEFWGWCDPHNSWINYVL